MRRVNKRERTNCYRKKPNWDQFLIASWIHSYFDNVMTKFMIRTDAWKNWPQFVKLHGAWGWGLRDSSNVTMMRTEVHAIRIFAILRSKFAFLSQEWKNSCKISFTYISNFLPRYHFALRWQIGTRNFKIYFHGVFGCFWIEGSIQSR